MTKFHKVTDPEEKIIALVRDGGPEGAIEVFERNAAAERTSSRVIDNFNQRDFNGPVTQIDEKEFEAALHAWGVDPAGLSNAHPGPAPEPAGGEPAGAEPKADEGAGGQEPEGGSEPSEGNEAEPKGESNAA